MKFTNRIWALGMSLALFLPAAAMSADEKRITTEKEFRELVVDRSHASNSGTILVSSDNKIAGTFGGKEITGHWNWTDGTYCRTAQLGDRNLGYDCSVMLISGDRMIYVRNSGKGKRSIWTLGKR